MNISSRIDHVVHIPPEYMVPAPPPPVSVKVELIRDCNYRCKFCFHSQLPVTHASMSWQLYKDIVQQVAELGIKEIAPFFFGESFLDPRLPRAIDYAKHLGIPYVFLTTNGSCATENRVSECMRAGLDSLKFSLNFCDQSQMAEIAGVPGRMFETVVENIRLAREIRDANNYKCGLFASYIVIDDKQRERMQPLLGRITPWLDEIYELPLYTQAHSVSKEGWAFTGGNIGRIANSVPAVPCWGLFREAHINYDGTMCACSFSVGEQFTMGNLATHPFMEAWHSEKFQELRRRHLAGEINGSVCCECVHSA